MPSALARPLARLIDELSKLPGVGPKTAQRLAYHILRTPAPDAEALAAAIRSVKTDLRYCGICFNIAETDPCVICSSDERDATVVTHLDEIETLWRILEHPVFPRELGSYLLDRALDTKGLATPDAAERLLLLQHTNIAAKIQPGK